MSPSFQTFIFEAQGRKRINPLRINPLQLFAELCRLKFTIC